MTSRKPLIIGAICAFACVACVLLYAQSVQEQAESQRDDALERFGGEQVEIVVASRDIAVGESLSDENTMTRTWLVDLLPADPLSDLSDAQGLIVSSPIVAGEVVSASRLDDGSASSIDVPAGYAAVSIPSQPVRAVGGMVSAGTRVDVYCTSGTATDLIAQDVLILGTSVSSDEEGSESLSWVTLALRPELVQEVITASQSMELYLAIPADGEDEDEEEE